MQSPTTACSDAFRDTVSQIRKDKNTPFETKVGNAELLIKRLAKHDKNVFEFGGSTLHIDRVLAAMLSNAPEGGESKDYTVSAILACVIDDYENEKTIDMLVDLGKTWVTHFLFIFKTDDSYYKTPVATPKYENPASHMVQGVSNAKNREDNFRGDVLMRDGYKCVIAGDLDREYPNPPPGALLLKLIGARILPRAVAIQNPNKDLNSSSAVTMDILRNYAGMSTDTICQLDELIDDPCNGLMLEVNVYTGFDDFHWCLKSLGPEDGNRYKVHIYNRSYSGIRNTNPIEVVFEDHSQKFLQPSDNTRKRARSVALPDPHFIRIHAAIAGVLHMSGAGKFLDDLLRKYGSGHGSAAVRSWDDLERSMQISALVEMLHEVLVERPCCRSPVHTMS